MAALGTLSAAHLTATGLALDVSRRASDDEVVDVLRADRQAGRHSYDLALLPHRLLGLVVRERLVAPLDAAAPRLSPALDPARDFFGGWWRSTAWFQDRAYGYPFAARTMSLWTRGDLWDEADADAFYTRFQTPAGPPSTWAQFERQVDFQHRPAERRYGTVAIGESGDGLATLWLQVAMGFGARLLDAPAPDQYGDIVVNAPEARRASELYRRLLAWSPPGAGQFSGDDALRAYQDGSVAMAVMWHDLTPRADSQMESTVPMRSGYEPVPSENGTPGTLLETLLLVRLSDAADAVDAATSIGWLLSHEAQLEYTMRGGFSARPSVYEDPRVKRNVRRHLWTYPNLVTRVMPLPTIPETPLILQALATELAPMAAGAVPPRTALDRVALKMKEILPGQTRLRYPPGS